MPEISEIASSGGASYAKGFSISSSSGKIFRKVLIHTGKAAWILGTTLLVLGVPLVIEMDREQQLTEMENQQMSVLSGGAAAPAPAK